MSARVKSFMDLRAGDRVTMRTAHGQVSGRAQLLLCNPRAGTVVLNLGGPHGTPGVCTPENFVSATRRAP